MTLSSKSSVSIGVRDARRVFVVFIIFACAILSKRSIASSSKRVSITRSPSQVNVYDYAEITATVASPDARNPFEDAGLIGSFETADGSGHWNVNGFCDLWMAARIESDSCLRMPENTNTPLHIGKGIFRRRQRQYFKRSMPIGPDFFGMILSIPGTLSGKARANISFSMELPLIG